MLRATWTRGRRGASSGASAAVACLTVLLAGCGGTKGDGYAAVGPPRPSSAPATRPTGSVTLVPLDTPNSSATKGTSAPGSTSAQESTQGSTPGSAPGLTPPSSPSSPRSPSSPSSPVNSGHGSTHSPSSAPTPAPTKAPPTPAALTWGAPSRKATDKRWCEDVTLAFRNSGGTVVRSGTVTLGTHIIGALGIDWATIESTERLPAPIAADEHKNGTWTVCVEAWRVPLGMHIETRDVSVRWD
ncbi:hypothetical protein [Streptomyces sp. NPDC096142]|uniref:hypothetical protein n=1 Tax=Streptomyces sp. NPDC096142 TaxID=3366077 RepID=UPI00382E0C7B